MDSVYVAYCQHYDDWLLIGVFAELGAAQHAALTWAGEMAQHGRWRELETTNTWKRIAPDFAAFFNAACWNNGDLYVEWVTMGERAPVEDYDYGEED